MRRCYAAAILLLMAAVLFGVPGFSGSTLRGDESQPGAPRPGAQSPSAAATPAGGGSDASAKPEQDPDIARPMWALGVGIAIVLFLIIAMKVNAFMALITAAMVVSVMGPGSPSEMMTRVAESFGRAAGQFGIVIGLAAVIGTCMLDSGAADRIVRFFVGMLGERKAPLALMGSGFILAVPVFFDTVFYLLVPLARSLFRRTNRNYLLYVLAIGAGGAATHTLVPPTPGPLVVAGTLGIDMGTMILVGLVIALPGAMVALVYASVIDRMMPIPLRKIGSEKEPEPIPDDKLPPLWLAALPVVLPVILISANTALNAWADAEHAALLKPAEVADFDALRRQIASEAAGQAPAPGKRLIESKRMPREAAALLTGEEPLSDADKQTILDGINGVLQDKRFHDTESFSGVVLSPEARKLLGEDRDRMKAAVAERMNRMLLESAYGAPDNAAEPVKPLISNHEWNTNRRNVAGWSDLFGNANLALLLSTVIALAMVVQQRQMSRAEMAHLVETSLMSAGVIILITAAGGSFGAMLQVAKVGDAIRHIFSPHPAAAVTAAGPAIGILILGYAVSAVLKIAQGSSTVAMITASAMLASLATPEVLAFHPVYLATSIGCGSLFGSWMNDSGFWIVARMSGLTEVEALKSWTVMIAILGGVGLVTTIAMAFVLPMV